MIKKALGIIAIIFLQFNVVFAQSSFEISGVYALTAEKLTSVQDTRPKIHHSFGINGKKIFQSNVFIQSGLFYKNFGSKFGEEGVIIDDLPSEIVGQSLEISINVGYYFFNKDKIRVGISVGVNNGFLRHEYQDYYGYIVETFPVYKDYLFHLNSSVEIGMRLTDNIIVEVRPVFQRQINSNYGRSYKQSGIGCQVGISYIK